MGKKKKNRSKLLNDDYTNISSDDQFKLLELSERLMRGESVGIFGTGDKKPVPKKKPIVVEKKEEDIFAGYNKSSVSARSLVDNLIKTQMGVTTVEDSDNDEDEFDYEDKSLDDYVQDLHECTAVIKKDKCDEVTKDMETSHTIHNSKDTLDEPENTILEETEEGYEEEETLDNQFKVLTEDLEIGDIVINDAWKRYKSHTISFVNMKAATMDYQNSSLYDEMCGFLDFTIALIAGPVLIIREGNPKFQRLIDKVESLDTERIFFVTKTDEELKNENGEPATHILMYYIDKESKDLINILIDGWEDNGDNEIVLDFFYSVYKKATDRYENPFSVYAGIDALIDSFESSDADIDYVIDLILKDEDTVVRTDNGGNHYEHFLKNIVMSGIEAFVACPQNDMPIFETFKNLLSIYFEKDTDEDIIKIPTNFGLNESTHIGGPHVPVDVPDEIVLESSEKTETTTIIEEYAFDEIEDESDIDLDEFVDNTTKQKDTLGGIVSELSSVINTDTFEQPVDLNDVKEVLEVQTVKEVSDSGVKKFGSKPYDGGSMIISV